MTNLLLRKNLEPLLPLIENQDYKEIIINKPFQIAAEKQDGQWVFTQDDRLSLDYLYGLAKLLAVSQGKRFDYNNPILAASIDDLHRVNIVYGKQTNHNISFVIRLKRNNIITLDEFANEEQKECLIKLIKDKKNILIAGGTGSGKTTLLNSLVRFINPKERIITIENVREIELPHQFKHHDALIYLQDRSEEISNLVNSCLRMRPDRILIGELRIENSYLFLKAANSGHDGTIATIHASSTQGAIDALIHNIKSASQINHHDEILRSEILRNLDAIVHLKREYCDGKMQVDLKIDLLK